MPANDLVPCYYKGQLRRVEAPAEFRLRVDLHEMKAEKLGKFVDNGQVFLFEQVRVRRGKQLWDGLLTAANVLAFSHPRNPLIAPDKLHYEMPMAGDRTTFARHRRHLIHVSGRSAPELRFAY
jgi:hypothetical protein